MTKLLSFRVGLLLDQFFLQSLEAKSSHFFSSLKNTRGLFHFLFINFILLA